MAPPAEPERLLAGWLRPQARGVTALGEHACIGTRTGAERKTNQDRALVARFADARSGYPVDVFVVCDGMGGMADGGTCAEVGAASFLLCLVRLILAGSPAPEALDEAIQHANRRVFELFGGRGGTTLVALISERGELTASSVGDSRLSLVRTDGASVQLSRDDTMKGALDALGQTPVERSPEHDRLVQFVGMGNDLQPQVFPVKDLEACRFLLLTTDGADRLKGDLLSTVWRHASTAKQVVERGLHIADWLGGVDDATVIAVAPDNIPAAPYDEAVGLIRVWGSSPQQLALWLPPLAVQGTAAPPEISAPSGRPPPPGKAGRQTRGRKSSSSRKRDSQEALPLPESPELIIKLGESISSPAVIVEQRGATGKKPSGDPHSGDGDQ